MSLQDIEKLAPKRGVVLQSVKEVVQALVDDDLGESVNTIWRAHFWRWCGSDLLMQRRKKYMLHMTRC